MDIVKLYQDHAIDFIDGDSQHRHARPGWVNTVCPFCTGNPGYHLGYNLETGNFVCWRCGFHKRIDALVEILQIRKDSAILLAKKYGGGITLQRQQKNVKIGIKALKLPSHTNLQPQHVKYLQGRGFDAEFLQEFWGLRGTGPVSMLDGIDYKHRILAPIYWRNQIVSFQTRDITNKHKLKYITCAKIREIVHHKHLLYGKQELWTDTAVLVEGITDVWRFGVQAVCGFGIKTTPKQLKILARQFKRVVVAYDEDPQAQRQARKIVNELRFRGVQCFAAQLQQDPASMKQDDADALLRELLMKIY